MPGRSGYPQNGGVSIALRPMRLLGAQADRAAVVEDRVVERCRAAPPRLKASTVASSLSGGRFSCVASSLIELAAFGGNTDGMNRPAALASTIENAIWSGCRATRRSPDGVALRPEVFALVVEALGMLVDDDPEREAIEPRDDAAVELRRTRIDGDRVALARVADRLRAGVEHQPQKRALCCTAFRG